MNYEQAVAFDAARRRGLSPDEAAAHCGYTELALESAESRHRAEALPASDDDDGEVMVAALLARSKAGWAPAGSSRGPRAPKTRHDVEA